MSPMPLPRILSALAALSLLAACSSSTPLAPAPPPALMVEPAEVAASRFVAGAALLSGFDELAEGDWQPGDCVLLGIGMDRPGRSRQLYMKLTALPKMAEIKLDQGTFRFRDAVRIRYGNAEGQKDSGWIRLEYDLVPLQVELYDDAGGLIFETTAMMPELCLRYGLVDYIELERSGVSFYDELPPTEQGKDRIAGERQMRMLAGWLALMRLPQFLHRDSMQGLVWDVVERPSLLSIVREGGISMGLAMKPENAQEVESPLDGSIAYRVPMAVQVNDRTAMDCTLLITRAAPPLGPCSGLLAMEAVNPRDGRKRLTLQLLAARRSQVPDSLKKGAQPSTPPAALPASSPSPPTAEPAAASPAGSGP